MDLPSLGVGRRTVNELGDNCAAKRQGHPIFANGPEKGKGNWPIESRKVKAIGRVSTRLKP
jgi:hypothetical protein